MTTERGDAATPTLPAGRRAVLYAVRRRGEEPVACGKGGRGVHVAF